MNIPKIATPEIRDCAIVSRAAARAAERLEIPEQVFARILGVSEATVHQMKAGNVALEQDHNAFKLAILFVRFYQALDTIVGNQTAAASWLKSSNTALNARPIDIIQSTAGLLSVINYLETRRP